MPGRWRRWSRMRSSRRMGRGIRLGCCWGRRSRGCRSWCRSGTGGCWCRPSPSTGERRCRWPLTWPPRLPRGCGCSCAGTRTCPTSARSPRRNGGWSSTSTTSTKACPGPFEWDVKRLAASLAVAGRDNGFPAKARRKIVLAAAEGYRTAMRAFADQPLLDGLVRASGHRAGHRRIPVPDERRKGSRKPRRCWPRRTPRTAPRRCASSPPWPTGGGGSSATPR